MYNKKYIGESLKEFSSKNNIKPMEIQEKMNWSKSVYYKYINEGVDSLEIINNFANEFNYDLIKRTYIKQNVVDAVISKKDKELRDIEKYLNKEVNFVIYDKDGEILNRYGNYLEKYRGYTIKILNLCDTYKSNKYNPFNYFENEIDIRSFCDFVVKQSANNLDNNLDYQKTLLEVLCSFTAKYCKPHDQNLLSIMKLLRAAEVDKQKTGGKSKLDRIIDDVATRDPNAITAKRYLNLANVDNSTVGETISKLSIKLNYFDYYEVQALCCQDDNIGLNELFNQDKIALFILYPSIGCEFSDLYKMLTFQLVTINNKHEQNKKVSFLQPPESLEDILSCINSKKKQEYEIKQKTTNGTAGPGLVDYKEIERKCKIKEFCTEVYRKAFLNNLIDGVEKLVISNTGNSETILFHYYEEEGQSILNKKDLETFLAKRYHVKNINDYYICQYNASYNEIINTLDNLMMEYKDKFVVLNDAEQFCLDICNDIDFVIQDEIDIRTGEDILFFRYEGWFDTEDVSVKIDEDETSYIDIKKIKIIDDKEEIRSNLKRLLKQKHNLEYNEIIKVLDKIAKRYNEADEPKKQSLSDIMDKILKDRKTEFSNEEKQNYKHILIIT